jgi:phenylalanyl-tRNA synthetase alpha chain
MTENVRRTTPRHCRAPIRCSKTWPAFLGHRNPNGGLERVREAFFRGSRPGHREHREPDPGLRTPSSRFGSGSRGEKSGVGVANRQMRSLSNQHKKEIGKLLGQTRAQNHPGSGGPQTSSSRRRHAERILVEEAVDVTAGSGHRSIGGGAIRWALLQEQATDMFVFHGVGSRGRPRGRIGVVSTSIR